MSAQPSADVFLSKSVSWLKSCRHQQEWRREEEEELRCTVYRNVPPLSGLRSRHAWITENIPPPPLPHSVCTRDEQVWRKVRKCEVRWLMHHMQSQVQTGTVCFTRRQKEKQNQIRSKPTNQICSSKPAGVLTENMELRCFQAAESSGTFGRNSVEQVWREESLKMVKLYFLLYIIVLWQQE